MSDNKTALPKGVKTRNIVLLVIAAFFLFLSVGGIFNIIAQGRSDYMVNIVIAVVAALLVLRTGMVLKGKAKPIKLPAMKIEKWIILGIFGLCAAFMVGLVINGIKERDGGMMTIALLAIAVYGFAGKFLLKEIDAKRERDAQKREELRKVQEFAWKEQKTLRKFRVKYLDDVTYVQEIQCTDMGGWKRYDVLLAARGYGWDMMRQWADYMAQADLENISLVNAGALGAGEVNYIDSYQENDCKCMRMPELEQERGYLAIGGLSPTLRAPIKIVWYNQTRILRLITPVDNKDMMACYAETMVRRTFGTEDAMKLGKPLPETSANEADPVTIQNGEVHIDSAAFYGWKAKNPTVVQYEKCGVIALDAKEPVICLYDDGVKTREYCLQTEGDEDFTGKYFLISVRVGILGNPPVPMVQIDGFISDTEEDRKMTLQDVGYRMEGYFLSCAQETTAAYFARMRGHDLPIKGLKYPGYTTPSNVRLMGICPECGKSFCFHGYAFYMTQSDVAYSDDGLDCCEIPPYELDKETWFYQEDGKTFRYYNSFNCPHCGTPYIDYPNNRDEKVFGVSGCVHLGRKAYRAQ